MDSHTISQGDITVTTDSLGRCIAVSRHDEDRNIVSVIWEYKGVDARSSYGLNGNNPVGDQ